MNSSALHIEQLVAGYADRRVINRLSLTIERGQWLAVVGANGSGKSTLLDCVSGRHRFDSGDISIDGQPLLGDGIAAKSRLGYAVAADALPAVLTGNQCLSIHAQAKQLQGVDDDRVGQEMRQLAIDLRLQPRLDEPVSLYSYGTRQKLGVLMALLGEPALIVLDESFNGLDPASGLILKKYLRARVDAGRCAILLATHSLDIVERYCDRAVLLDEGVLVGDWDRAALNALRDGEGLEAEMACIPAR